MCFFASWYRLGHNLPVCIRLLLFRLCLWSCIKTPDITFLVPSQPNLYRFVALPFSEMHLLKMIHVLPRLGVLQPILSHWLQGTQNHMKFLSPQFSFVSFFWILLSLVFSLFQPVTVATRDGVMRALTVLDSVSVTLAGRVTAVRLI